MPNRKAASMAGPSCHLTFIKLVRTSTGVTDLGQGESAVGRQGQSAAVMALGACFVARTWRLAAQIELVLPGREPLLRCGPQQLHLGVALR